MAGGMSKMAKQELLETIRDRYQASSRKGKSRILGEFIAVAGHHCKHGIRLLGQSGDTEDKVPEVKGRRIYDEAVRAAVILVWEASDRICGKRLKAALPHLVESMERHGHLDLEPEVRERLLAASAATLDRLLKPIRSRVASRRRRRRNLQRGRNIPMRTQTIHYGDDWNQPPPGFLEIDLVAHCGESMGGSFVYSLVATDVCTAWTEAVPLLVREQSLVVAGLEAIAKQLPFPVKGIDSDNDSVFINDPLTEYCADLGIEFTRCRPYRKNDQAWVEQKNGARCDAAVRELLPTVVQTGGENPQRLSGDPALQSTGHALRPSDARRGGQRRSEGDTRQTPSHLGPGGVVARHQGNSVGLALGFRKRRILTGPTGRFYDAEALLSCPQNLGPPEMEILSETTTIVATQGCACSIGAFEV